MIQVEELSRLYGTFAAVDGVSFEIGAGEVVGLLGHNGAGKTTIMKMLTGVLEPTSGRIRINGLDPESDEVALKRLIGYLPENCPLYPEMTVAGFLEYCAALHGVPQEKLAAQIRQAIDRTGLREKALAPIATLSRGYRQRVGVAQAILHKPKIVILDEPTNGLDPEQIHHMRDLIRELARESTVILSTHILQEVQAVCERVIILRNGRKAIDSRLDDLQQGGRLLLTLDSPPDRIVPFLRGVQGVEAVEVLESGPERFRYAVQAPPEAAPQLVEAALQAGTGLYGLEQEWRSLERVFAEVTERTEQKEEQHHA